VMREEIDPPPPSDADRVRVAAARVLSMLRLRAGESKCDPEPSLT
jgi:hypothetical protein